MQKRLPIMATFFITLKFNNPYYQGLNILKPPKYPMGE